MYTNQRRQQDLLLKSLLIAIFALSAGFALAYAFMNVLYLSASVGLVAIGCITAFLLIILKQSLSATNLFLSVLNLAILNNATHLGPEVGLPNLFFPLALMPFLFFNSEQKKLRIFWCLVPFTFSFLAAHQTLTFIPQLETLPFPVENFRFIIRLVVFGLLLLLLILYNKQKDEKEMNLLEEHRAILISSPEGILKMTSEGNITFLNPAGRKMTPIKGRSIIGKNIKEIFPVTDQRHSNHPFIQEEMGENLIKFENGDIPIQHRTKPLTSHREVVGFVVTFRNIALQLKDQQEVIQNAKLTEIGSLATGIAHEINNPLATSNLILEKLKEEVGGPEVETLLENNKRISVITKSLLNLSRDARLDDDQEFCFRDVISDVYNLTNQKLRGQGIHLQIIDNSCQCTSKGQPILVSQVLLNLINNAAMAIAKQEEKWIKVECKPYASYFAIYVTDSGFGIPNTVAKKMFSPFYTTKKKGQGTGLGLSLARQIIENHQGTLELNRDSINTQFVLKLPLISDK